MTHILDYVHTHPLVWIVWISSLAAGLLALFWKKWQRDPVWLSVSAMPAGFLAFAIALVVFQSILKERFKYLGQMSSGGTGYLASFVLEVRGGIFLGTVSALIIFTLCLVFSFSRAKTISPVDTGDAPSGKKEKNPFPVLLLFLLTALIGVGLGLFDVSLALLPLKVLDSAYSVGALAERIARGNAILINFGIVLAAGALLLLLVGRFLVPQKKASHREAATIRIMLLVLVVSGLASVWFHLSKSGWLWHIATTGKI